MLAFNPNQKLIENISVPSFLSYVTAERIWLNTLSKAYCFVISEGP